jgi:deoxyribodipyrimidine photo-lyase
LPLFIFDPQILSPLPSHDRRVSFIFESVMQLKAQLRTHDLELAIFYGNPTEVIAWLLIQGTFDDVVASGDYDPYARQRDTHISHLLPFKTVRDTYLLDPNDVLKKDGTPYLVFTPFYHQVKKNLFSRSYRPLLARTPNADPF